MTPAAIVIGSGFSSLSAASYLAKAGYEVTVLEKNGEAGGRARTWSDKGFTFDIGPTWYWMPDVFENFFADFDHSTSDYYSLTRLDPSYRIFYGPNTFEDISASRNELDVVFEKYQPGSSALLADFLNEAKLTYQLAVKEMAFKPGHSLFEFLSTSTITNIHLFT
ncbi:MAG: FAD-dependent oxidoreductase, partial [Saprospiraceae bacterium]